MLRAGMFERAAPFLYSATGCALASICAREGCLELVFELLDGGRDDDDEDVAGWHPDNHRSAAEHAVLCGGGDAAAGDRSDTLGMPRPSSPRKVDLAAELAAWLQEEGLLDPACEPQLLVQVAGQQHVVRWLAAAAAASQLERGSDAAEGLDGTCASGSAPDAAPPPAIAASAHGAWHSMPPAAGAEVGRVLRLSQPCVLLPPPQGCGVLAGPVTATLQASCSRADARGFAVRCMGADLAIDVHEEPPLTHMAVPQPSESAAAPAPAAAASAERSLILQVAGLPRCGGLLLVEACVPRPMYGDVARHPAVAADDAAPHLDGGGQRQQQHGVGSDGGGRMLLVAPTPCLVVQQAERELAAELASLHTHMAGVHGGGENAAHEAAGQGGLGVPLGATRRAPHI